jgi:hypothetical protein
MGQRRDVVGAFKSGGDPGVHPGGTQSAEVGDERVPDEGVDEADEAWAGLVEEPGDDARVQRVHHPVLVGVGGLDEDVH